VSLLQKENKRLYLQKVISLEWTVEDVVCDYGLFENGELKLILSSRRRALEIKKILEEDLQEQLDFQAKLI